MSFDVHGALRRSLAPIVALASISFVSAGECIPDLTHYTPTPTLSWSQSDHNFTEGYRVYWKRAEDVAWRGSIDLKIFPGSLVWDPVYPGITEPFPIQRLVPTSEQRLLVDVRVVPYSKWGVEGHSSTIIRICMPEIWTGGPFH